MHLCWVSVSTRRSRRNSRRKRALRELAHFFDGSEFSAIIACKMLLSTLFSENKDSLVITNASPVTSFDWSDFPLVHQFNPEDDSVDLSSDDSSAHAFELEHSNKRSKLNPSSSYLSSFMVPSLQASTSSISSSSSENSSCSDDRRVSFAPQVQVREYDLTIGNHLSCDLLPIALGWTYSECSFEDYASPRRVGNQLKMTYAQRRDILTRVGGYSEEDLSRRVNGLHHVATTDKLVVDLDE